MGRNVMTDIQKGMRRIIIDITGCTWRESLPIMNEQAVLCRASGRTREDWIANELGPRAKKMLAEMRAKQVADAGPTPVDTGPQRMDFPDLAAAAKDRVASWSDELAWVDRHIGVPLEKIDLALIPSAGAVWKLEWASKSPGEFAKLLVKETAGKDDGGRGVSSEDKSLIQLLDDFKKRVLQEPAEG